MPSSRDICFESWGKKCEGCGVMVGIEAHHIDENKSNDDPQNLMPLCGTCHNLVHAGTVQVDHTSRAITVNFAGLFEPGPSVAYPSHDVQIQMYRLKSTINDIWEVTRGQPFALLQDGVNQAYYTECHIPAESLSSTLDFDAMLNPEDFDDPDEEDYKLNRDILELHGVFRKMQEDAEGGRPFSDIIVEFNSDYRGEQPLKILAGQHRSRAICDTVESGKETQRLHQVKIYLALRKEQRAEISLISNTNIAIAKPLIDRFGEQSLGPVSREWSQKTGLLPSGRDFADRVAGDDRFTVQLIRAFVINYCRGVSYSGDMDGALHESVYIPKTGAMEADAEYLRTLKDNPGLWDDAEFTEAGRQLARLFQEQRDQCVAAPEGQRILRSVAYRYKVFTPTIVAAWAYVAGLLQRDQARLQRHYALPYRYDSSVSCDPLNARQMSLSRHENYDEATYRGLGTRQSQKDTQRLAELFLLQSQEEYSGSITTELLRSAVLGHVEKVQKRDREIAQQQARLAAQQVQRRASED